MAKLEKKMVNGLMEFHVSGRVFVEKKVYVKALRRAEALKGSYQTNFRKWGNSVAIRIPKRLLSSLKAKENSPALIFSDKDKIIIQKS